jgi:hypothetical protein
MNDSQTMGCLLIQNTDITLILLSVLMSGYVLHYEENMFVLFHSTALLLQEVQGQARS